MPLFNDHTREFVAGTAGGWAQVVVGHPFDTLKVRLQTQAHPPRFHNGMDCLRVTLKEEGPRGLYKGVMSPLAGIGICNAVLFTANGYFRSMLRERRPEHECSRPFTVRELMLAGGLSGLAMALVNCPVELLKVKLQVQFGSAPAHGPDGKAIRPYAGVIDCGVRSFQESGLRGLYRGIVPTFLRDFPSFAAYFGSYELLKRRLSTDGSGEVGPLGMIFAGGTSGVLCWLVCWPQDVIKSRMQSDPSYRSTMECVRSLIRQNGGNIASYFKGFGPTMARAFPANAATFLAYEYAMGWMRGAYE
ncbi:mitochondrial carrier domain-containing protein [Syncephalis pseudoplumigaleata]|uniref:Mitochondrial carrier domain-containing protein n=1 Tax=Syncephalis pseudoplumigaleata TaxID=1712513 RepID=A0A4P9YX76_9FUNG|nr:mitochondrial carrier domain-containing protein [Syncephalis pseudoplumigaleata]|eukprot:RKP24594.1 mitochondrial carrier domain-containing protein [Syncephalis pseudoplumigaleata]